MMNISDTNIINEDYCSFETAKLLKEKGFNGECVAYFSIYKDNNTSLHRWRNRQTYVNVKNDGYTIVPTHQMAFKWLREVHNIVIEINLEDYMTNENGELQVWYSYTIWTFIRHLGETGLTDSRYDDRAFWQENVKVGQSYEQAVEAALKYTLENLI